MDKRTLLRLEFDKVIEQLAGFAGSALGRERALGLAPTDNLHMVLRQQAETSEGRELLRLDPAAELYGWRDVKAQLQAARRGFLLTPEDFIAIGDTLRSCRIIKRFFTEKRERYPILNELAIALVNLPELENRIKKVILPEGEVADGATAQLGQVRQKLSRAKIRLKEYLDQVIRSAQYQKYIQDPIVTIREGRYVIPVKIEYRSQMPGIVHDQSTSGATLFVEPMAALEKNNEIRSLEAMEKQEVQRILAQLSDEVAKHGEVLLVALDALGELDFVLAKAKYSQKLDAWAPVFVKKTGIKIKQGRHPLLTGKVVPVDLELGHDFDTLVITGPNTGGKTVALKTAGIMVLMAQAGLHLPAEEGTSMGIFGRVFTDIGDEQSIEESLSTFSGHLVNIVEIVDQANRGSLVLLDELGAGTDPTEGAALAQAILEKLHNAGAKTIATTHYNELKTFAYTKERVENACVEFDHISLRPTYRLLTGHPGRSNAFETAQKLGLPPEIIQRARAYLTVEQIKVEDLMRNLEVTQQEAEESKQRALAVEAEAMALKEKHNRILNDIQQKREKIINKAVEEADKLVKSTRYESEETIKALREKLALEATREREQAIREAREKLTGLQTAVEKRIRTKKVIPGKAPKTLRGGEEVYLPQYRQNGFVLSPPGNNGEVLVQVGIIKVSVPVKELRLVEKRGDASTAGYTKGSGVAMDKAQSISMELDLRGQYPEDALQEVDKYLDDAFLAGLPKVRLIHGKGTGSLRTAVQNYLKTHPRVKTFNLGEQSEGGLGVTVVELA